MNITVINMSHFNVSLCRKIYKRSDKLKTWARLRILKGHWAIWGQWFTFSLITIIYMVAHSMSSVHSFEANLTLVSPIFFIFCTTIDRSEELRNTKFWTNRTALDHFMDDPFFGQTVWPKNFNSLYLSYPRTDIHKLGIKLIRRSSSFKWC